MTCLFETVTWASAFSKTQILRRFEQLTHGLEPEHLILFTRHLWQLFQHTVSDVSQAGLKLEALRIGSSFSKFATMLGVHEAVGAVVPASPT